ncbi:biopolymer transporter ExbD [Acidipila sp. EB88]|uniref:ExbD/TolR family protein n=1 Tax=Acidipila sp. EB88 TaxID=2305226 RepID=UPI000F5F6BF5|nr:biopolymer transporter ExbD [Acidipila sp. EB88]RRA48368.1 biopolymer transporter ExbD [Acidipila sp. EB88]
MALVNRDEGKKVNSNINVTPMVDVMLVLLIIFMVITPMLNNKVNVTLVNSKNAVAMEDASKEDAVTIAVTRDGKVFLGQNQVAIDQLGSSVQDLLKDKPTKMVFFRADARAHYGGVEDAIDSVRTAGVEEVGLLTDQHGAPGAGGM